MENKDIFVTATQDDFNPLVFSTDCLHKTMESTKSSF